MINQKAIGYITANYASRASSTLLKSRPLASLPIIGRYRLIDFPLSNMCNAGIRTVGLVMPGNFRSIIDHIGSGRDWMLDRKKGGMFLLPGNAYGTSKRGMRFLLRDIISNRMLFLRSEQPHVVMCASNIIFNLDLDAIIDAHETSGAGITMIYHCAERPQHDVSSLEIGEGGRVTAIKTGCDFGDNKFLDCFIIERNVLIDIIDHYASADYLDLFEAIAGDFARIDVCSYEFKGLSIGVFDENTYYQRSMELLDPDRADQLFMAERPIRTKAHDYPPAKYVAGSYACNSLISAGCMIRGTVRSSILSRGVVVESGASVANSIIMQSCVIKSGARVEHAIIDKNNVVAQNTELRGTPESILVIGKVAGEAQ
ncbi:glucose-1-phosphate adenylyltransferase, GlgD subunit [Coriobacterium glomerans PW2]|uniref:Glucose-1-phosphate adenylyltransferase, GlgD subunit n=1 Tax=Coriobacterium glomerans (strain ATCC 49209 / DSM 20642 / JCM 10262 / PW2) TaxID=700015 RepID=F2N9S7_CORGP|nr:glucose-1-phosphate adenylyltransferase subunit GlgD [Coriobacterium glomerans]AEB07180.1 glucose-1-phosphate adenylyltransferase, GlgD subunit [Coriobacterium glomerans PW2]